MCSSLCILMMVESICSMGRFEKNGCSLLAESKMARRIELKIKVDLKKEAN